MEAITRKRQAIAKGVRQVVERNGAFSNEFAAKKNWKLDPGLWSALTEVVPVGKTVVELGAGIGRYIQAFLERGNAARGIDGIPGIEELSGGLVIQKNLAEPLTLATRADWTMCVEVGEHIPSGGPTKIFLDNLAKSATSGLVVTYAYIGQPGRNHINCRQDYWVANQLGRRGWNVCQERTEKVRQLAGKGWDRKLLVFCRCTSGKC